MNKNCLFLLFFVLFSLNFLTGQISFYAEINPNQSEFAINQRIQVNFILNIKENSIDDFDDVIVLPTFDDFEILNRGMSQNTNIINGKISKEIIYQILLRPLKTGNLTIDPAKIKINGKNFKTKSLKINVLNDKKNPVPNKNKEQNVKRNSETFALFEVDKKEPYINEGISLNLVLYTQNYSVLNSISGIEQLQNFSGALIIPVETNQKVEKVQKNGEIYLKATLQEYILYPNKSGKIIIPANSIRIIESDGFFSQKESSLNSEPYILNVKSLPNGKPQNFSGAVGNFSINLMIDKTELNQNSSAEVEVELIGKGNFKLLKTPDLIVSEDLENYSPTTRNSYEPTSEGLKGKIVAKSIIVPSFGGKYTLKTEPFTYFNPEKEKYETINSKVISIDVKGSKKPKISSSIAKKNDSSSDSNTIKNPISNVFSEPIEKIIKVEETQSWLSIILISGSLFLVSFIGFLIFKKKKQNLNQTSNNLESSIIEEKIIEEKIENNEIESKQKIDYPLEINHLQEFALENNKVHYFSQLEKILKDLAQNESQNLSLISEFRNQIELKFGENQAEKWNEFMLKCQTEKYSPFSDLDNNNKLIEFHSTVLNNLNNWI